ncbi:MAG: ABC transporter substrate-binding protein [Myxococcales bacterium]|jgi:ABC-type branched-subunit amino acid transport system substrate-binding protein
MRKILAGCALLALAGCSGGAKQEAAPAEPAAAPAEGEQAQEGEQAAAPGGDLKAGKGVDVASKTIKLGVLNDESGPAATIGKPYAVGKRVLAAQVNAGGSGLLPEGWKIELVEKDHGYNPQKSVQAYNQIKDDVLLIAHSFGTPNTLPLRPMLERDEMIALPASLSSEMAKNKYTIPAGPSYEMEAMRGMDYIVEQAGDKKGEIKAGIVYQQDDYGQDGLNGWKKAAEHHGVKIVSEQAITPTQRDFAAVVTALKEAGATHVLLTVLPSASGPILGTAAQLQFMPQWLGCTPTWIDGFFNPEVIPSAVFANFHWVSGMPYWGEDLPGMKKFLDAYEKFGKEQSPPDMYLLMSYMQGTMAAEAIKRAIEKGDVTREGVMAALTTIENFDAQGLSQPLSFNTFPYVTSTTTRVLKPDFEKKSWTVLAPYASPKAMGGAEAEPEGGKTAQAEPAAEGAEAEGAQEAVATQ